MSVQGIPVGGVHTVRQSVATNTVTFHAEQNGLAIAVILRSTPPSAEAPVVKAQRNPNCFTKAERTHRRAAIHHALNNDGARDSLDCSTSNYALASAIAPTRWVVGS